MNTNSEILKIVIYLTANPVRGSKLLEYFKNEDNHKNKDVTKNYEGNLKNEMNTTSKMKAA